MTAETYFDPTAGEHVTVIRDENGAEIVRGRAQRFARGMQTVLAETGRIVAVGGEGMRAPTLGLAAGDPRN